MALCRLVRCFWCVIGLLILAPGNGISAPSAQDVANAVLSQVATGLPALVRKNQTLSDAVDVPMLEEIDAKPFDTFNDLSSTLRLSADTSLLRAFADNGVDTADDIANGSVFWSDVAKLGAVTWRAGTAECDSWQFFEARAGRASAVPAPAVLTQGLCEEGGQFGNVFRAGPYMVATSVVSPEDDLMNGGGHSSVVLVVGVQVWNGASWTEPERLQAVLDYSLNTKPAYRYCPEGEDCAGATRLGLAVAQKFESRGKEDFLPMRISTADMASYKKMLALSQTDDTGSLPASDDSQSESVDWDFGDSSTLFPAYLDGELVLGRIGHGQMAWRENSAWDVGFWALDDDGKDLDEVAGLIFERDAPIVKTVTIGAGRTQLKPGSSRQ